MQTMRVGGFALIVAAARLTDGSTGKAIAIPDALRNRLRSLEEAAIDITPVLVRRFIPPLGEAMIAGSEKAGEWF